SEEDLGSTTIELLEWFRIASSIVRPLSVDLSLSAWDPRDDSEVPLTNPYWALRGSEGDHSTFATSPAGVIRQVEGTITPDALRTFISEATQQSVEGHGVVSWSLLEVSATEARLPNGLPLHAGSLVLQDRGFRSIVPVVERADGAWLSGPSTKVEHAPFTLMVENRYGALRLRLTTYWSIWGRGGVGWSMLEELITVSIARGWELVGTETA
nr:hypothetical protein [Gemmatimonadaceae bacterium]